MQTRLVKNQFYIQTKFPYASAENGWFCRNTTRYKSALQLIDGKTCFKLHKFGCKLDLANIRFNYSSLGATSTCQHKFYIQIEIPFAFAGDGWFFKNITRHKSASQLIEKKVAWN